MRRHPEYIKKECIKKEQQPAKKKSTKKGNPIKVRCNTEEQIPLQKKYKSNAQLVNQKPSMYAFTSIKHAVSIIGPSNSFKNHNSLEYSSKNGQQNKKKQRSQSAHLLKGNKFVHKLLNLSVLGSQSGASIVMTDEETKRYEEEIKVTDNLREFMNSIDIRIIKNMKKDSLSGSLSDQQCKINEICEERIKKVSDVCQTGIQKTKDDIVSYYQSLFHNATMNAFHSNLQRASQIDIEIGSSDSSLSLLENDQQSKQIQSRDDQSPRKYESERMNIDILLNKKVDKMFESKSSHEKLAALQIRYQNLSFQKIEY